MGCLHNEASIKQTSSKHWVNDKQTSSKHQAIRAHVVHVYFEYICLTFAWCLLHRVNTLKVWHIDSSKWLYGRTFLRVAASQRRLFSDSPLSCSVCLSCLRTYSSSANIQSALRLVSATVCDSRWRGRGFNSRTSYYQAVTSLLG